MTKNFDFRAFYCRGRAAAGGPVSHAAAACVRTAKTDGACAAFARQTVLPAPQPPYVLAFFALFALLPFALASSSGPRCCSQQRRARSSLCSGSAAFPLAVAVAFASLSLCVTSIYWAS